MPKRGMRPVRRGQLIGATIATIGERGFADASVVRIARRAGLSPGVVHHYFADKNALLEAAMRDLLRRLNRSVITRLALARHPVDRIKAVIDGNFGADQFHPTTVAAWLALWAQARHAPELARLREINAARLRSNLRHDLRRLMHPAAVEDATFSLAALIDGMWLHAALSRQPVDSAHLSKIAKCHLDGLIGCNPLSPTPESIRA